MFEGLKRMFEKPKSQSGLKEEHWEKSLENFKIKTKTPEYQKKISQIINDYHLRSDVEQSVYHGYIGEGSQSKNFLTIELESFRQDVFNIIKNKKPPFIICELGRQDDRGITGNIFIPIDEEIRIMQHDYVLGYGSVELLAEELGYKKLKAKNGDDFNINEMGWPLSKFVVIYELKENTDKTLLTANTDPKWIFE